MPFDAMGRQTTALTDSLNYIGVIPVPERVLEDHQAEQVRLHPQHVLHTAKPYMLVGAASFVSMIAFAFISGTLSLPVLFDAMMLGILSSMASFLVAGSICYSFGIRLRTRALWTEHYAHNQPMPPAVRDIIQHVRMHLPEARFYYGELVQNAEVLDPYVVVMAKGERACLGIWDDSGIIRIAEFHP